MLTLASITAALAWLGTHIWVLLLALVPQVLSIIQPVLTAIVEGLKGLLGTIWEGLKSMNFSEWVVALTIGAICGAVGYHFGWQACIDWVHAHFKLVTKIPLSHWWKFW